MGNWYYLIIYYIVLNLALLAPVQAENLPDLIAEERATDLSGKLSSEYMMRMESQLQSYPFQVRAVYLPDTKGRNLGLYAAKLFEHWHLPADSMLVVVALDRRKIGIHAGQTLKAKLKDQAQQDQEIPLESPSPSAQASEQPENPNPEPTDEALDLSSGLDHLELVPQAIEDVSDSLKQSPAQAPSGKPTADPLIQNPQQPPPANNTAGGSSGQDYGPDFEISQLKPLLGIALLALLGLLGWFGFGFWRKRQATQNLISRYSLQGQVAYDQLEKVYENLEAVMPDFHGYLGETETKLGLFIKSITRLENEFEQIFDAYDDEVRQLSEQDNREAAIEFFQNLDQKLEEGKQLHEQALVVLRNLKEVSKSNQQASEQANSRRQAFSQEISEIRKLHPGLKLVKIQQAYQQALNDLQRLEKQNERDPLGAEKGLKDWLKQLTRLESEARSLPHLWQQFNGDIKQRISGMRQRLEQRGGTPAQQQQQAEIEKLHKNLLVAIEQGDLNSLNRLNDLFTRKLQQLESEI